MSVDAYSESVRRLFADPVHAGDLPAGYARAAAADAIEPGSGFRVHLAAALEAGILRALRYRVFGCPHLIAAAEAACQEFEGRPVSALREFSVPATLERLAVPVEKMGRILLLEDALRELASRLSGGTNGTRN